MNLDHIFEEIAAERKRQHEKWGEQNMPMLVGDINNRALEMALANCKARQEIVVSWFDILQEEVFEAFLETEPKKQRIEMIQVAAVAVQIIEYLNRRIHDD